MVISFEASRSERDREGLVVVSVAMVFAWIPAWRRLVAVEGGGVVVLDDGEYDMFDVRVGERREAAVMSNVVETWAFRSVEGG